MKLNNIILSLPFLGLSVSHSIMASQQIEPALMQPYSAQVVEHTEHGHEHTKKNERAPTAQSTLNRVVSLNPQLRVHQAASVDAMQVCDLDALANASAEQLVGLVQSQGTSCVNDLFSASSNVQVAVFTNAKMNAVAEHAKTLASNYAGTGSNDLTALFLFIRAGFYVEFYNDAVTFDSSISANVKLAIDAFVNNSHFYDNNNDHGKVLQEVITTMDSAELQHEYLQVVRQWLTRFDENYASSRNMRNAVNGIFTILFRGQWNDAYVTQIKKDTDLVNKLVAFTQKSWMVNSDAEFLIVNASGELARLKQYGANDIDAIVTDGLKQLFSTYKSYGFGDALWLNAADVASYYTDCSEFGICNFEDTLTQQVLSQTHQCSSTIRIRSQEMTPQQLSSACDTMAAEETRFHTRLATNQTPVADDNNSFLQVNIFNSSNDYKKYAKAIFKIDTNNGGMYLEGDPSKTDNQANFVAYEASYAKADHFVWNLEHEYVHYLDGRFDLYGGFNAPTEAIVWWSEGVAEYIANLNDNQKAIDTIKDGSVYNLQQVFATTYDGFDQDRIYRWGYLAVRYMFERHNDELNKMLAKTRVGDWAGYQALINDWQVRLDSDFTQWTQELAMGENTAPVAKVNGPYSGNAGEAIAFSSEGSSDAEGEIASYQWDFGDGNQSAQANPSHIYDNAGEYTVTLTVTDSQGLSNTASTEATVAQGQGATPLKRGQAVNISGQQNEELLFVLDVPQQASNLNISLSGGSGDADLYVRYNSEPTRTSYDCRPYVGGNSEQCDFAQPQSGKYFVMVRGYNAFSNVKLVANFDAPIASLPDACETQAARTGGRAKDGELICLGNESVMWFSLESVDEQSSVRIETANGSGDLTLEYSNSGWPNGTNVDARSDNQGNAECISVSGQSQFWGYLKVSGDSQAASLKVTYNDGGCI
ncbi:PKD domain-containing protein [Pseudoalteromonas sp. JBTF-M23]|uniref:microbial collagenase n=1 Tax=Pseudoalteromonas caenipelagi TaxID=2726988 RepID=A0A849VCY8_9GAMM|nr:collagenase [Pseudoalteromonas caenipelagi]NOU50925.1 PKD domain-containing protein [Pseudoalteromonas caenipelagi]